MYAIKHRTIATSTLKPKPTEVKPFNGGSTLCASQGTTKMKRCMV